jgi:hypothetical protein
LSWAGEAAARLFLLRVLIPLQLTVDVKVLQLQRGVQRAGGDILKGNESIL